jgi:hypothetical protein
MSWERLPSHHAGRAPPLCMRRTRHTTVGVGTCTSLRSCSHAVPACVHAAHSAFQRLFGRPSMHSMAEAHLAEGPNQSRDWALKVAVGPRQLTYLGMPKVPAACGAEAQVQEVHAPDEACLPKQAAAHGCALAHLLVERAERKECAA